MFFYSIFRGVYFKKKKKMSFLLQPPNLQVGYVDIFQGWGRALVIYIYLCHKMDEREIVESKEKKKKHAEFNSDFYNINNHPLLRKNISPSLFF